MKKRNFVSLFLALSMLTSYIPSNVYAAENTQLTQESGTGDTDYVASSGALDVNYEVTGQWETGFNGNVTLTNTSDSKVEGWEIRFQLPHEITNIWNAQIVNKEDNIYTVKNAGYNANIQPKESVSFGFTAALDGEIHLPTATDLTSAASENSKDDYSVEYRLTNDWQTGYNAEIVITNNTDKNLEGWHLEFDYDAKIDTIWNAAIDKNENNHYSISNADYNSVIAPNSSLTIGFLGHDLNGEPQNFVLYSNKNASIPVSVVTNKTTTEATTEITTSSVNNSESTTESKEDDIEDVVDYSIDSDYDGLPDIFELHIGTDIHKEDTDDDKISDYYEKIYGLTDPLIPDSDGDEIADCDEDHDTDGLTFLEEVTYGTNPLKEDSDLDTLSDFDEVNQYGTDPILWDTDTDTLSDGDDVLLGFDPLLYDTDNNTVCDADEKVLQTKHVDITCEERPELTGVDVEINMCGNIADNLQVTNVLGVDNYTSDLVGLVGAPIDITCYTSFDNANITYHYDKSLVDDATAAKLGVLSYDETTGLYEDKNAVVDIENGTVSFSTNHFCSLPMCNIEEYKTAITDIPDYILDDAPCNSEWNGKVVTVAEASKILKVSQSDITALAKNQNLYALKATAVYNLKNGTTLKIPHRYFSTLQMGETGLWQVSGDDSRRVLAPYDWDRVYTSRISSSYNFGYEPDGTKGYLPFYDDINLDDPGYLIDEERYFIPSNTLDTTNKDKDDLYDVYEYLGMRLSNGNLFFTSPKEKDMDGDHIPDGKEIVLCEERGGLFRMVSNPIEKDSDGDEIEDNVDPDPLKTNKNPDVNVTTTIVFPDTEPYSNGRAYYFSAYAQNNTFDRLMNYGFDIRFYYGDEENPTEDEFTITDPSSLGVMVIDGSKTEVKHILPSLFAEKTWKILVDDTVDMEKLKCMAVFRADNLKNEISSVTKAQDFIVADPDYYKTTLKASVSDSYLVPEIRGERAFSISAGVYNYKNFSMKNIKATITFDNPENIEFLEDFTSADATKCIDKIQGKQRNGVFWEIRVKEGVDLSSVKYKVIITADGYDEFVETRNIDKTDYDKIRIDWNPGKYITETQRYVHISVTDYEAKNLKVNIKHNDTIIESLSAAFDNKHSQLITVSLECDNLYTVEVTTDEGETSEQKLSNNFYLYSDDLFSKLIRDKKITFNDIIFTKDGFSIINVPLSKILEKYGIDKIKSLELDENREFKKYDAVDFKDWYLYSTNDGKEVSIIKLRPLIKNEKNEENKMVGVAIPFISFDEEVFIDMLEDPTKNQDTMYNILTDLAEGNATPYTYNRNIAQYFASLTCEANYLLANMYIEKVVENDLSQNNTIKLIDNKNSRITEFLKTLDDIYDEKNCCIKISDSSNLSLSEKQAILATRTGNTSFNSFAAEVIFHAEYTNLSADIKKNSAGITDNIIAIAPGAITGEVLILLGTDYVFKHGVKADLGYDEEKESSEHYRDPFHDNDYSVIKALKEIWGDI